MTDEQIIKALECLASEKDLLCYGCEYRQFEELTRYKEIAKESLALIQRLTAQLNTARADTVRGFAERLEAFVKEKFDIADGIWIECDDDDEVANAFYFSRTELLNDVSGKIKSIAREMTEGEHDV